MFWVATHWLTNSKLIAMFHPVAVSSSVAHLRGALHEIVYYVWNPFTIYKRAYLHVQCS